ncbi:hypothetical protein CVT25_011561 [Psilocybe cyanescens]|uniref:Uncharacterized protein n=1 Tax=Psilocybe cyanescens TaxID=93625 RepID=A0A409X0K0_PSICY|nr:hypothetical protein CVT25_011561 [Psilocybe cyanescens]
MNGVMLISTGETLATPSPADPIFVIIHSPTVLPASAHPRADHVRRHIGCLVRERGRQISSSRGARTIENEVG